MVCTGCIHHTVNVCVIGLAAVLTMSLAAAQRTIAVLRRVYSTLRGNHVIDDVTPDSL